MNSEDRQPKSEKLINTDTVNMREELEASTDYDTLKPPSKRTRTEMTSPALSDGCTSPASTTSEYVDAKEKFDSPRKLQHAGLILCYLDNSIEITTRSGEKINVKNSATTIKSGPCKIDIKNGVVRIQTVEMDSLFNFKSPSV